MGTRNHYFVLGVQSGESAQGIRAAFRDLAKRFHPDRVGPGATSLFQAINAAYGVLADPERRRAYDHRLQVDTESSARAKPHEARPEPHGSRAEPHEARPEPHGSRAEPHEARPEPHGSRAEPHTRPEAQARARATPVEPLIPDVSMRRDLGQATPSMDAMLDRIRRNFDGVNVPKGEGLDELNVGIAVSAEQAARGARIRLGVPVFGRCPSCAGHGRTLLSRCSWCGGQGLVESERVVAVDLPPMAPHDAAFVIPLSGLDIHNFYLRVHVHVEPRMEA
ncbi:DnaJ domain-containing protein [Pendulispora albinea]|uniref:DnaJ domain-containing protein n=1 Tax=Pendulispora albinea TaxID=2741071 RepID=A0ABZ2LYP3_9BACT